MLKRWLTLAAGIILLDQLTKWAVLARFVPGERLELAPFFNLILTYNSGAAFSFLAGAGGWQKWFFVALALGVSAWIVVVLRQHPQQRLQSAALSLIMGGALGNVIDRFRFGAVVDFLDFYIGTWHWPAFNVADSAICIGAALLIWEQLRQSGRAPAKEERDVQP